MSTLPAGFKTAESKNFNYTPRLIVIVGGLAKHGKTTFALTGPKKLAYMNFDKASEEDVLQYNESADIIFKNYWPAGHEKQDYFDLWDEFEKDYRTLLHSEDIRTIVWDTGTELWNVMRMAYLGKLAKVLPHNYVEVNSEYRRLLDDAQHSKKNLIITSKLKAEYIEGNKTGNLELSGFSESDYVVQVITQIKRVIDDQGIRFVLTIMDTSKNLVECIGQELSSVDGMCNFSTLGQIVMPNTSEKDWV